MKSKLELKSDFGSNFFSFTVEFKKQNPKIVKPKTNHSALTKKINDGDATRNFKILIVEDNKINMLLSKTLLKKNSPELYNYWG